MDLQGKRITRLQNRYSAINPLHVFHTGYDKSTLRVMRIAAYAQLGRSLTWSTIFAAVVIGACGGGRQPPSRITPAQAKQYLGREATVCGEVKRTHYAVNVRGQPTFIDLDRPHPNALFTVVIWEIDRKRFTPPPDELFRDRRICVTGQIRLLEDRAQIVVRMPSEIEFDDEALFRS